MTGYGRAEMRWRGIEMAVELRTVNHRFSELSLKLPKSLAHLEPSMKEQLSARFARGRIDLAINVNGRGETGREVAVDEWLAGRYIQQLRRLQRRHGLRGELQIGDLARVRELVTVRESFSLPSGADRIIGQLVQRAARRVAGMRRAEGKALAADLARRLGALEAAIGRVRERAPLVVEHYQRRLRARASELAGAPVAPERLAQEAALFADRSDVSEELVRLDSHVKQFRAHVKTGGPVGRTLDFLVQEMGREINTIGSKANDAAISSDVVAMKGELEKIREQVQNVE
ncbi:MAG: YicC/YloC family endoribonuclease [Nitrospirota bacterium]